MYAPGKLESTFIEIICAKTSNLIIVLSCLIKHQVVYIGEFNINYISPLLHKIGG